MIVVYTALLGDSDRLKPAPAGADRCVCFTEDPARLDPQGWDLQPCRPSESPRHAAWQLRCLSHWLFPDASRVVWADASFTVVDLPGLLRDAGDASLVGMRHPERSSCYDEGAELVTIGQSAHTDVDRQLAAYRTAGFEPTTLSIAGLLIRRHTPAVRLFNQLWASELRRHPGDNSQLSLDYCAWAAGLAFEYLEGVYTDNPYVLYDHEDHQRRRRPYR